MVTTLQLLGLDPAERSLDRYRRWFAEQTLDSHVDRVMELAGVTRITMTNDVFDDNERERWLADPTIGDDPRFAAVLRFDMLLRDWPAAAKKLDEWGYATTTEFTESSIRIGPPLPAGLDQADEGGLRRGQPAARFYLRRCG